MTVHPRTVLAAVFVMLIGVTGDLVGATPPVPTAAAETRVRWLAMGDSYSSGEGIPGTRPGNPALQGQDNCVRANGDGTNAKAWAVVAAETLADGDPGFVFERPFFVACTGAIVDGAATQLAEMRAQVVDPALQQWNIVSFSFGGNSIGFADVIKGCLDLNSVWGAFDLSAGCDISIAELRRRIDMLAGNTPLDTSSYTGSTALPEMFNQVASAVAQGGHVLVVGYPNIVEEVARWDPWRRRFLDNCEGVKVWDVAMLRSATGYLNQQIALAAQAADSRWAPSGIRFHFVDIATDVYETSSDGQDRHALCSGDPWLNGQTLGVTSGDFRKERSFHPNQRGHTATGQLIASLLSNRSTFNFAAPTPTPSGDRYTGPSCPTLEEANALTRQADPSVEYVAISVCKRGVASGYATRSDFSFVEVAWAYIAGRWEQIGFADDIDVICDAVRVYDPTFDIGCGALQVDGLPALDASQTFEISSLDVSTMTLTATPATDGSGGRTYGVTQVLRVSPEFVYQRAAVYGGHEAGLNTLEEFATWLEAHSSPELNPTFWLARADDVVLSAGVSWEGDGECVEIGMPPLDDNCR